MRSLKIENLKVQNQFPHLKFKLSLQLHAGEIIGITGASGSGKSILFKAIADLVCQQGSITLDNVDKNHFTAPQWRKKVMLLPAESQWWFETVGEHFHSLDNKLLIKMGLNRGILSRHIHDISSGERQRLALLRAIQNQPEVLLLDEPTANLDGQHSRIIEEFAHLYIQQQKAILWISHNQQQLQRLTNYTLTIHKNEIIKNS